MRKYIFGLFVVLGVNSAQASCYKQALEVAIDAQEDFDFRYDEPYSGGRYSVDASEKVVFVQLLGACYGADPAIITIAVKFAELEPTCKDPHVEKIDNCLYLP